MADITPGGQTSETFATPVAGRVLVLELDPVAIVHTELAGVVRVESDLVVGDLLGEVGGPAVCVAALPDRLVAHRRHESSAGTQKVLGAGRWESPARAQLLIGDNIHHGQ